MNAWEQVAWIASEALMHLEDSLNISTLTARDKTADFNVTPNGYKVGQTVSIKTRPEYLVREFSSINGTSGDADSGDGAIQRQGIRESSRNMTIEKLLDVSVGVTAKEKRLDLESFSEQVIVPAAYALAEKCDQYVGSKILQAQGLYASDTLFADRADMALARKAATLQQLSNTGRYCLVDLDLEADLLGAAYFTQYDNRGTEGVDSFREGSMGQAMGMEFYNSINFPTAAHTAGTSVGTTNNGTASGGVIPDEFNQIGMTTLTLDGEGGTLAIGDRLQIDGVRRPVVVAGGTQTSVLLQDPISEQIPDNASVITIGTTQDMTYHGAIFDDQSMAVAMPLLDPPSDKPSFVTSNNGYSIRVVQGYDMESKQDTLSLDLLIGAAAYDPRRITLLADY